MAKMQWHTPNTNGEYNRFQTGVKEVALFPMSGSSYSTGVPWNGVTAISENPSGADITDLYADDRKYASLQSAEKFAIGIEAYDYPTEWEKCDGTSSPKAGVYFGQQQRVPFGLVYKTSIGDATNPSLSDDNYLLHIVYNCIASPSGRGYATINENPDAITMSWDATSTPVKVEGTGTASFKSVSTIVIDSTVVNKTKLASLEEKLYGRDAAEGVAALNPTMQMPADIINALK